MDAKILQDVGRIERTKLIRDAATKCETDFTYPKALDEKEVNRLKDEYTKNAIAMAKHEERKKEFMEHWKSEVKPLKLEMGEQMGMIRSRVEEVTEDVYLLVEHDEQMTGYYNANGELVYQRPMMPDEQQFSIVDASDYANTGTDK